MSESKTITKIEATFNGQAQVIIVDQIKGTAYNAQTKTSYVAKDILNALINLPPSTKQSLNLRFS